MSEDILAMIQANQGLVHDVIKKYFSKKSIDASINYDDLFQTGMIGLIQAAKHFDPEYGAAFSTFAYSCIKNAIMNMLSNTRNRNDVNSLITVSINAPIMNDGDPGDEINAMVDCIPDVSSDDIVDTELFESCMEELRYIQKHRRAITDQDVQIMSLAMRGYEPKDIANMMGLGKEHVSHRLYVFRRLIKVKYRDRFDFLNAA